MIKSKGFLVLGFWLLIVLLLIFTRFKGLDWGLPYPMHPDERNMANAIQQLECKFTFSNFRIADCFNPHFFAYGQFPLYLAYVIIYVLKFFDGDLVTPISFSEAAISLRLISALASILNAFLLYRLICLLLSDFKLFKLNKYFNWQILNLLILIFSPFFIQFSHFGTTESLLMLFYSIIIYFSLLYAKNKIHSSFYFLLTAFFSGLAVATKVSSVFFLLIPVALIFDETENKISKLISIGYLIALTLVISILFSPHNFISFPQFIGAMKYESDVALGTYRAFYTRQFEGVLPIIFQLEKIFPFALGWPIFLFSIIGMIFLPFKKEFNILRLAILTGFLSNAFFYAKWTRFVAPILPLMLVMAVLCLELFIYNFQILFTEKFLKFISNWLRLLTVIVMIVPGLAYLSIYQNPDIRFTVSEWIYKKIPDKSNLFYETANVIDPPIPTRNFKNPPANYQSISFNFYDLEENPFLKTELWNYVSRADYIFIPSRRVFANFYCNDNFNSLNTKSDFRLDFIIQNEKDRCEKLKKNYPLLNLYYDKLYSGELGFVKVAEFTSFPKIQIFGKTLWEFSDETAEETWTVFDHPVFRIYKRI